MPWSSDHSARVPWVVPSRNAGCMTPDPRPLEVPLERLLLVLAPMASRLHAAAMHPLVAPHDWSGPASRAYREVEEDLHIRVRHAAQLAEAAVHSTRRALGVIARFDEAEASGA